MKGKFSLLQVKRGKIKYRKGMKEYYWRLAWLGGGWLGLGNIIGLAWLGLAWLGLAWLGLAWLGSILIFPAKYDKIFYKSETLLITIYPRIHNLLIPAQEEINHQ
ncbi:hypothetical protein N5T34_14800 [Escherichia coli]|uniref:hypothetical protein n=1 Tax=Escherichia coli TaxID=562 RepID=UPI0022283861|nr:hypothetical protein [Escherichia coli]MCW3300499.1 hypothetical protein [Escherichia coli]